MGGASSYLAILAIMGFLSAAWLATKVSKMAGISSILLEITTGVVFGPSVLGLISKEYAVCSSLTNTECNPDEDFMWKLDHGQPVGRDLGRFVHSGACKRSDYTHAVHRIDITTAVDDEVDDDDYEAGAAYNGNQGHAPFGDAGHMEEHSPAGDASHTEDPHVLDHASSGDDGHAEDTHQLDHGEDHAQPADIGHAVATHQQPADQGHGGHHRRLSATGGAYKSFEECIQKSCEAEVAHECGLAPDVFTLIGHAGVALMIFESGMHFDFERARVVGPKACLVAVVGTILPLVSGSLLMVMYGRPLVPDAVSVGTALAPTSVGIALRLLGEAGVLSLDFGQAIITAAFVDDILSLVLFNVLFSLRGDFNVMATVVNPIVGVIFMGIAMVLAVKFWPKAINEYIMPRLPVRPGNKVSAQDEALFLIMIALLVLYGSITHFLGTHLWGCFIAGMSFACLDQESQKGHTHHVWVRQTKRITSWMIRIFFACTVAFSIPVQKLLSFDAFWKGTIMGLGPCVLSKVICAPFMGKAKFVIGWAMVGRAEFAYLIAQMAAAAGMIDTNTFSIAIWALIYATILAPIVFRTVLNRYIAAEGLEGMVDPKYAHDEECEEEEDAFLDGRFEQADYTDYLSTRKPGPVADAPPSMYGKVLADLVDPQLDPKTMPKKDLGCGWAPCNAKMEDAPAQQQGAARPRFWWGRQSAQTVDPNKGFLCCLFAMGFST